MAIKKTLHFVATLTVASLLFAFSADMRVNAADGPNRTTSSDIAAGRWMDSLLAPKKPTLRQPRFGQVRPAREQVQRKPSLQGKLVKNTSLRDGSPPYALVDRQGRIMRYIEPVRSIDLRQYLGQTVTVRRDTGRILLASQLALPKQRTGRRPASAKQLRRAQHEAPITAEEPTPAGKEVKELIDAADKSASDTAAEELTPEPISAGEEEGPSLANEHNQSNQIYEGEYNEGQYIVDGYTEGYDDGIDFGGCADCGSYVCKQFGGCGKGARGRGYIRGESMTWWFSGMETPALITQSNLADGGVLPNPGIPGDNPSTIILFGGEKVLDDPRVGGRVTVGIWLDDYGRQALEFDYMRFGTESLTYSAYGEDGNPTISRPFFDIFTGLDGNGQSLLPPAEAAEQVSSDILDGRVTVRIKSDFESFGIRFRHNLCCCSSCPDDCNGQCGSIIGCGSGVGGSGVTRRIDLLTGFRYARLDESLHVREDLIVDANDAATVNIPAIIPPDGTRFIVQDFFETENEFTGGELGFLWEVEKQRWSFELLSKLAVGNNRQRVRISGSTQVITDPPTNPAPAPSVGGLLAQSSNIGTYERDEFSIIPEVGMTLGYQATPRFKVTAGYTFLYWTNVLRPGDQIDRQINTTLIPDFDADGIPVAPDPLAGPLKPEFEFQNTNIWAQGLNIGGEYRW